MMLYMALLVFLLLVVLYQVYRMTEYFTATQAQNILPPFAPTADTKVADGLDFLNKIEGVIKDLRIKIDNPSLSIKDASMTDEEVKAFQYTSVADPKSTVKKIQLPMMSSNEPPKYFDVNTAKNIIVTRLDNDIKQLTETRNTITTAINSKKFKDTDTVLTAGKTMYPDPMGPTMVLNAFPTLYAQANIVYNYIDKFIKRNTAAPAAVAAAVAPAVAAAVAPAVAATTVPSLMPVATKDATTKANSVSNVGMGSMMAAVGPIGAVPVPLSVAPVAYAIETNEILNSYDDGYQTTDQVTTVPDSTPAPAECSEVTLSEETESRLVKNIMTQIKDQRLLDRSLEAPQDSSYSTMRPERPSTSTSQGSEWVERRPLPPAPSVPSFPPHSRGDEPDMSKYIRKDSIPCWNCSP